VSKDMYSIFIVDMRETSDYSNRSYVSASSTSLVQVCLLLRGFLIFFSTSKCCFAMCMAWAKPNIHVDVAYATMAFITYLI